MRFKSLRRRFLSPPSPWRGSARDSPPTLAQDAPAAPKALRLCADPTNLPFSSDDPAKPGIYIEIGEAIGKASAGR